MTQEHFLLQSANPAIGEQTSRLFFQQYEDLQNQWPWQDPVEHWVDHILTFAQKPLMMAVFLDPQPEGGGRLYFRVDGLVLPGSSFTSEQYHHLLAAIQARMVFPQTVIGSLLQEGFILTESGRKHWVGVLQTVTGVQITFFFTYGSHPADIVGSYPGLRRVCPHCVTQQNPDDDLLLLLQKQGVSSIPDGNWVQGQGCSECFGSGYQSRSRLSVVEAAYMDQSLAKLCESNPSREQLSSALVDSGFQTYFEQAFEFAQQGMTTLREAIRIGVARRSEL